ncbi:cytochrome P450 [Sporichthya polymorpha]|uniref:cytochrome P450 n=1 Tax=Sporichthya polymorpha TaxID=35751 RepID=UPI001FDEECE5|nr:cytochrome P450 [Sporichthya polymorpha]
MYCSAKGVNVPAVGNPTPFLPIELDPPLHTKYRKALQPWFSAKEMAKLEPLIRELVTEIIDGFIDKGSADLSAELAGPVPPVVIAAILGLPREDWAEFRRQAETLVHAAEIEDEELAAQMSIDLMCYLALAVEDRKTAPRDDMLTKMLTIEIDGERIDDDSVLGLAFFMLMAGHETSVGGISMLLLHMIEYPDLQRRLVEDPSLVDKAVEESLRLGSPIQRIARTVERDVTLNGVELSEGDKVVLAWGSANRDEVRFENADTFVVDRPNNGHLGFGDGIHRCLGASLARLEMRVVLEEVLRRIPNYRLADGETAEVGGILARHVTKLPVVW